MWKFLLLVVVCLILFFPTILSIPCVSKYILSSLAPSVAIEKIELGWFSGIRAEGVVVKDEQKRTIITSDQVVYQKSNFSTFDLGRLVLQKPTLWVYDTEDPFELKTGENRYTFTLAVEDGTINIGDEKFSNLYFSLDATVRENSLFLNKPLLARFSHEQAIESTLEVDEKGFRFPLTPFSVQAIEVQSLKIDPGIITAKNVGLIASIISLLKFEISSNKEVSMWFTPLYLELREGIVTCKRTDILVANSFPVALWGTVDLVKDRVDMILGLSSQALKRALMLFTLSSNYFLQIPIKGSVESPKADTTLATSKIAALRLQETLSPTTIVFGTVLGLATKAVDTSGPVPPPTTTPFPWESKIIAK